MSMHIVLAVVAIVPYEIALGLIYIYPDHRIYGIKCTQKNRFVSVGAIHESPEKPIHATK